MIFLDVTKTAPARHRSGLTRVTSRLAQELGAAATPISWPFASLRRSDDWVLTAELFSEPERPGITAFLETRRAQAAAIFHDAIPLRHPHITWPQSVARHPAYMKLLARFDRVWAVSAASRAELLGFWRWQGVERTPPVDVLPLGADFAPGPRRFAGAAAGRGDVPALICVGIIEPRKNQLFLLDVCEKLWAGGVRFTLDVIGRVNPHFGSPIARRLRAAARSNRRLRVHESVDDRTLADLLVSARATVLPTIAEGCGLPLLESLWLGVPCLCSDLPVLRENAGAGGCVPIAVNDRDAWGAALQRVLVDDGFHAQLVAQARSRALPTWRDTAQAILHAVPQKPATTARSNASDSPAP